MSSHRTLGKIVTAGYLATGDGAVYRLNGDGKRDTSFAGDGIVRIVIQRATSGRRSTPMRATFTIATRAI